MKLTFVAHRIDVIARRQGNDFRKQVILHLTSNLPCVERTLVNKMKKIRIQKDEQKLEKLSNRLSEVVLATMSDLLNVYRNDCSRIDELRQVANKDAISKGLEKAETQYTNPRRKYVWTTVSR